MGWKITPKTAHAQEGDAKEYSLYSFTVKYEGQVPPDAKQVGLVLSIDHVTTSGADGVYLQSTDNKDANGNIIYSNASTINKKFDVDDLGGEFTIFVKVTGDNVKEASEIFAVNAKTEYFDKGSQPLSGNMIDEKAYGLVINDDPKKNYDAEAAWKEALENKNIKPGDLERIGEQIKKYPPYGNERVNYDEQEAEEGFIAYEDSFDFGEYKGEFGSYEDHASEYTSDYDEERSEREMMVEEYMAQHDDESMIFQEYASGDEAIA